MCLILRFIVSGIQVVHPALQAGLHDGEVLVREGHVNHNIRTEAIEEVNQIIYIVGIHLCGLDIGVTDSLDNGVTFRLGTAGNHHFVEYVRVLSHFMSYDGTYTASSDN